MECGFVNFRYHLLLRCALEMKQRREGWFCARGMTCFFAIVGFVKSSWADVVLVWYHIKKFAFWLVRNCVWVSLCEWCLVRKGVYRVMRCSRCAGSTCSVVCFGWPVSALGVRVVLLAADARAGGLCGARAHSHSYGKAERRLIAGVVFPIQRFREATQFFVCVSCCCRSVGGRCAVVVSEVHRCRRNDCRFVVRSRRLSFAHVRFCQRSSAVFVGFTSAQCSHVPVRRWQTVAIW